MKRLLVIIMTIMLVYSSTYPIPAKAETRSDLIRVGLVTNFKSKSSLSISTTKLSFGYCVSGTYTAETTLNSASGFVFKPANGYFYASVTNYTSYSSAYAVAKQLNDNYAVTAYPALTGKKTWKIYLGGSTTQANVTKMLPLVNQKFGVTYSAITANNKHRVMVTGGTHAFVYDGQTAKMYPQVASGIANKSNIKTVKLGSSEYRGRIEIGCYGTTTVSAVGVLPMDEYLYGVVPAEMPPGWPAEALKAQATVARTYALNKTGYGGDSDITTGYKIYDTTASQVYQGYGKEVAATNNAVNATSGKVIYHNNKVIDATFFSTSGGSTTNSEDVWSGTTAYLRGVPDIHELEPAKAPWTTTYTAAQLKTKLSAKSVNIGTVSSVKTETVSSSGYVSALRVTGSTSFASIQKDSIRSYLGLFSNRFKVVTKGDTPDNVSVINANGKTSQVRISASYIINGNNKTAKASSSLTQYIAIGANKFSNYLRTAPTEANTYVFAGMGYGHGVGMSQSGAKGMASAGYNYQDIIKHYFTGVTVK